MPHFAYPFFHQWIYLGCVYLLAIVNNAAMNIGVQVSLQDPAFHYFGCIPRSGIAGSIAGSFCFLIFEGLPYCFPWQLYHSTFPPRVHSVPISPHPHQHLFSILKDNHPNECEVVSRGFLFFFL